MSKYLHTALYVANVVIDSEYTEGNIDKILSQWSLSSSGEKQTIKNK